MNTTADLKIDPAIQARHPGLLLGAGIVRRIDATPNVQLLQAEIQSTTEWLRAEYTLERLKDEPNSRAYRDFYWRLGIDPTKQRPAAEALARRLLRGESLPRINAIVDAYNCASLRSLIAIGAYDLARIEGGLVLRLSREGEEFEPIGGKSETLHVGQIVLVDEVKVAHLYPYRDSKLSTVSKESTDVLFLSAGVPKIFLDRVLEAARMACESVMRVCGGRLEGLRVVE
jgi:DNA/RNA-binding domain of Phe-tRNA-synthetase-like protein